jgi:hypothetical protein
VRREEIERLIRGSHMVSATRKVGDIVCGVFFNVFDTLSK